MISETEMDAMVGPWDGVKHDRFYWIVARPDLLHFAGWYLVLSVDWQVRKVHYGPDGWTDPEGTQLDKSKVWMYAIAEKR